MKRILFVAALLSLTASTASAGPKEDDLLITLRKRDEARAERLLRRGANPNAQDQYGTSALMLAAELGLRKTVNRLLFQGASVHLRDKQGFTVLSYGFPPEYGDKFYKRGAHPSPNDNGILTDILENSIWIDSDEQDEDVKVDVLRFVRAGGNLNHCGFDESGTTPLHNAVQSRPSVIRFLLDLGANPNLPNRDGETPLMSLFHPVGAMYGQPMQDHIATMLLDRGAYVNVRDQFGQTLLMNAIQMNRYKLVQRLLRSGANVNAQDKEGRTALMICADKGLLSYTKLLLSAGANVHLKNKQGQNALDIAEHGEINIYSALSGSRAGGAIPNEAEMERQAEQEVLHIINLREQIARLLWERGAQPAQPFRPELFH